MKGAYFEDISTLGDDLYRYEIRFDSNDFIVLTIFWTDGDDSYSYSQMTLIVSNVLEELIQEKNSGYMIECDGVMCGIISIHPERRGEYRSDILSSIEQAQKFIRDNFKFEFTVACSSLFHGIENANIGYQEAMQAMRYKNTTGIDRTLFYDEITSETEGGYYYPFVEENKLHNLIQSGNAEGAKSLIDNLYAQNCTGSSFTDELAWYLMFNISATVFRTVNEMSDSSVDDLLGSIKECSSVGEIKKRLFSYIDRVCDSVHNVSGVKDKWISADVIPYIEEHYQDCNLSVSMIADAFNLHPVYISRVFKEQTGTGLFEYISKYRVEQSKKILTETNFNLEQVAASVGYTTSRTFARMFKQIEGVTPGKYRLMHSK